MTTQLSLSLEVVYLINWLLKHEKPLLHALVKRALERGLIEELSTIEDLDKPQSAEFLYTTLAQFLDFLENNLVKQLETISLDTSAKNTIIPALRKIDIESLDFKTVWASMQQTKARLDKKPPVRSRKKKLDAAPQKNATDILFEEILKNWKPNNKETVN